MVKRVIGEVTENQYKSENALNKIFWTFTMLGIFIACLGLFGLMLFVAEKRTKEIGIRKVLGSSIYKIVLLLNKNLVKWVPQRMSQLIRMGKRYTDSKDGSFGRWGLVYDMGDFYFHTMWIQGFGGRIFKKRGRLYHPQLDSKPVIRSMWNLGYFTYLINGLSLKKMNSAFRLAQVRPSSL